MGRLKAGAAALFVTVAIPASASASAGQFVIGDGNAVPGNSVEFWGAQWWKLNVVSGGTAPASFKGFADNVTPSGACTGSFTTDPGNSSGPPPAIGPVIPVLVTSNVTKVGPVISGEYVDIDLVATNPGYEPDPGHPGTGEVIGSLCGGFTH